MGTGTGGQGRESVGNDCLLLVRTDRFQLGLLSVDQNILGSGSGNDFILSGLNRHGDADGIGYTGLEATGRVQFAAPFYFFYFSTGGRGKRRRVGRLLSDCRRCDGGADDRDQRSGKC